MARWRAANGPGALPARPTTADAPSGPDPLTPFYLCRLCARPSWTYADSDPPAVMLSSRNVFVGRAWVSLVRNRANSRYNRIGTKSQSPPAIRQVDRTIITSHVKVDSVVDVPTLRH